MEEVKRKQAISIPEVKEILEKEDPETMDQIQRWTYDYVTKFAKMDTKDAKKNETRTSQRMWYNRRRSSRDCKH
jgi:DNA-directed RNA polymerase subunit F